MVTFVFGACEIAMPKDHAIMRADCVCVCVWNIIVCEHVCVYSDWCACVCVVLCVQKIVRVNQ